MKIRLNPQELVVSSFDSSPSSDTPVLVPSDNPTPETGCFDCPIVFSQGC